MKQVENPKRDSRRACPSHYRKTLLRRKGFIERQRHLNDFDRAEVAAIRWALKSLPPRPGPAPEYVI